MLLNGKQVLPAGGFTAAGQAQQLRVNYGGNLYGISFDQIWSLWGDYYWLANDGADLASGPAATPTPPGLPTFAPPYTPSPEGTTISGGSGSVQTADGIFTFGNASGSGWELKLNGLPIGQGFFVVDQIKVYASGQLFFHRVNGSPGWYLWTGNQGTPSTGGPTSAPVPVDVRFSPSHPSVVHTVPVGTHVADVLITMSDGSGFSGVITLDDTTHMTVSGTSIVTNASPLPTGGFDYLQVFATQNGSYFQTAFDVRYT